MVVGYHHLRKHPYTPLKFNNGSPKNDSFPSSESLIPGCPLNRFPVKLWEGMTFLPLKMKVLHVASHGMLFLEKAFHLHVAILDINVTIHECTLS